MKENRVNALQRVGILALLPGFVQRLDGSVPEVLSTADLEPQALEDPDNTIPIQAAGLLLQTAASNTRCPHFGLELGKLLGVASLGLIGEVMRSASTLGILGLAGTVKRRLA